MLHFFISNIKNREIENLIVEFDENSSFPCKSTEDFRSDLSVCAESAAEQFAISAGSEIIARIHLRRPSVPNLRNAPANRRRPTSGKKYFKLRPLLQDKGLKLQFSKIDIFS